MIVVIDRRVGVARRFSYFSIDSENARAVSLAVPLWESCDSVRVMLSWVATGAVGRRMEMRLIVTVAMLATVLTGVEGAKAQTELRASVDLSEWTPSQNLVLNLATGSYVVKPPNEGWPKARPQPVERRGRLAGESLRMTRTLAEQAFKSGLTDKDCEAKRVGHDLIVSNAVGPMVLMLTDSRVTQTSAYLTCRTGAANALFSYITRLFDHRSP